MLFTQSKINTTDSYITYKSKLHFADFNGDGRADVFCLPDASKGATWTGWRMYLNSGSGNFTFVDSGPEDFDEVYNVDLNGDGKEDLIMYDDYSTYGVFFKRHAAWISTGNSFNKSPFFSEVYNGTELEFDDFSYYDFPNTEPQSRSSDSDGDGNGDVFVMDGYYNWKFYTYSMASESIVCRDSGSINECDNIFFGDYNGDGKSDIWAIRSTGITIYNYNGSTLTAIASNTSVTSAHNFRFGDFNGDGKFDIFVYGYNDTDMADWEIHLSMGTGFDIETITQLKANLKDDKVKVADLNGDGASDLMVMADENSPWIGHQYYITKRNAWGFQKYVDGTAEHFSYKYFVEDFDGDGRNDYLCIDGSDMSGWWNGYKVYKSGSNNKVLLKKISNGLNHLSTFNYESIAEEGTSYQKGTGASFPVMDFQAPLTVVSSVSSNDGVGGNRTINYTYEGAKLHRQGKGLIGFTATTSTDAVTGISTRSEFDYDNARFYSCLKKTIQKKGTTLIGETTNIWDYKTTTGNIGFPYVSNSVQNNALNGHTVTNTFSYEDAYGNLKERKTIYEKGNKDVTLTVTNNIITNDVTNWRLGKVEQVIEKAEAPGEDPIVKTTNITYSTDGILKPDFIKVHEGTDLYYSRDHDYDSYGNLVQLVERGANVSAKQTNYTYDPINGIRIKTMIDPSSHETEYFYDGYGRLTKVEDYLDNSTAYLYDNMGRRKTVSSPGGFVTNTKIEWGDEANLEHELYYIENSGNDNSKSITWCDTLGRVIRRDIKGFDGNDIYTRTIYDNKGQIDKVSLPSTFANTLLYNDYTFDDYGRIDLIAHHSGRNDDYSYEYGSSKVTQTVGEKTSWKITDSQGLLTFAHDNGGDITYTYYPNGQVKNIAAPGNGQITSAVTAMKYDIAGNQTELSDPSAGTIIYKYDAFGRLKEQTNGRSQKTIYNYYADGRIDNIQNPVTKEGTTTYTYNGLEQLTGISNPATNVSKSFIYETSGTKGRLKTIEETIDGKVFSTTFEYDGIGRIKQRIHPSGIVEENEYQNGYLKSIKANNDLVWQLNSMNEFGQITGSSYGGEHSAIHNYTAYGLPDDVTTGTIQSYDYTFDDTQGWPNYRENRNKANCYESFEYDTKNRLDLVKHGSTPWIDMEYQDNGNIITKTDVAGGTNIFEYNHSTIPYALTDVNVASIIPEVPQNISYTSFEQPNTISENKYKALFTYNDANQRCKMLMQQNGVEKYTRYYAGSRYMEQTLGGVTTESYTWIGGDAYSAPAVSVKIGTGAAKIYYLFRDYLGTITHVVEKGNPTNRSEYSFDAWGRRRKAASWNDYNLNGEPALFAARGFTGHEHLSEFGLINMNGRLYDPVLGRFLSPDNYVQARDFTQSFNRYSYTLNNPLVFTDPSGEKWRWGNPFYHFRRFMDWLNKEAESVNDFLVEHNAPSFGFGYNSENGTFHYIGNSGNIYHNDPGSNANTVVNGAINNARAEYYAYHNWEPAGLDNILNQQFVGTSPLAEGVAEPPNKVLPTGVFFFDRNGNQIYNCFTKEKGFGWRGTDFRYVRSKNIPVFQRALGWQEEFFTINKAFELSEPASVSRSEYTGQYYMVLPKDGTYWFSFMGEWGFKSFMPSPPGAPSVGHDQVHEATYGERWKYESGVPLNFDY
nr:toxin TcdB middle/N-terminal domain-containing protein [uncultured Draconibacterium sp.]